MVDVDSGLRKYVEPFECCTPVAKFSSGDPRCGDCAYYRKETVCGKGLWQSTGRCTRYWSDLAMGPPLIIQWYRPCHRFTRALMKYSDE